MPGGISLKAIDDWPVDNAAAGVVDAAGRTSTHGDATRLFAWASVTKPATALAALVAAEEGSVELDDVAPLLAHASGMAPDERKLIAKPLTRRIYSNAGFEALAEHVAQATGIDFADYLAEAVLQPLGMTGTSLQGDGSPAKDMAGPLDDLLRLAHELLRPTLISAETHAQATAVAFPGLDGVLPGYGRQRPNDWGLGFEIKDGKSPHWTGARNSPATFGHFGRSGAFVWVDPVAGLALAVLTDREFGPWAANIWPELSDSVIG